MNLKTFTIVSSIAVAALLVPVASAQNQGGGARSNARALSPSQFSSARSHATSISPSQFSSARSSEIAARPGSLQNGSAGSRWSNGNGSSRWNDGSGRHSRGCYPRFYPYYYSSFGYNSFGYGYPFGYGYGFGSSYGYPYYGASASLYYNGYHPYRGYRSYGNGGSIVSQVQQRLASSGYYRGPIDGVLGGGTRSAIRGWERDHGLHIDGRIDDRLLSTMKLS